MRFGTSGYSPAYSKVSVIFFPFDFVVFNYFFTIPCMFWLPLDEFHIENGLAVGLLSPSPPSALLWDFAKIHGCFPSGAFLGINGACEWM